MINLYSRHILIWTKKFLKSPYLFSKKLINDIKKDFYPTLNLEKNPRLIWCIGLPKSGTTIIENILDYLGYVGQDKSCLRIFDNRFLENNHDVSINMFKKIPNNKFTYIKTHSHYNLKNYEIIKKFKPKVIISLRNLKDTMISRYFHIMVEKNHWQYKYLIGLEPAERFKKSLTIKNVNNNNSPLEYFYYWLLNWKKELKQNKFNYITLNYEEFENNKKNYILKILNFLNFDRNLVDKISIYLEDEQEKLKKNGLKKNLKLFTPSTYNPTTKEQRDIFYSDDIDKYFEKHLPDKLEELNS